MTSTNYAQHFSSRNVPFGIASSVHHEQPTPATRIHNTVIFLDTLAATGLFEDVPGLPNAVFSEATLNHFAALGSMLQNAVRRKIQDAVSRHGLDAFPSDSKEDVQAVTMHLPVAIGDFAGLPHVLSFSLFTFPWNIPKRDIRFLLLPRAHEERRSHRPQR